MTGIGLSTGFGLSKRGVFLMPMHYLRIYAFTHLRIYAFTHLRFKSLDILLSLL